jgi:hypothetical protein
MANLSREMKTDRRGMFQPRLFNLPVGVEVTAMAACLAWTLFLDTSQ